MLWLQPSRTVGALFVWSSCVPTAKMSLPPKASREHATLTHAGAGLRDENRRRRPTSMVTDCPRPNQPSAQTPQLRGILPPHCHFQRPLPLPTGDVEYCLSWDLVSLVFLQ